jgi:hypothetical protein
VSLSAVFFSSPSSPGGVRDRGAGCAMYAGVRVFVGGGGGGRSGDRY